MGKLYYTNLLRKNILEKLSFDILIEHHYTMIIQIYLEMTV